MKKLFIIIPILGASATAYGFFAQAGNFSSETTQIAFKIQDTIQHAKTISEWHRNYQKMTEQLETMTDQLDVENIIKDRIGDPFDVDLPSLDILSVDDFLDELKHGIPWDEIIELADGSDSLDETHNGLFEKVEAETVTGVEVTISDKAFKKYAVVDQQYTNYVDASNDIDERLLELQENQALTLEELEAASTDAEVQKLAAIVNAQNGQITLLISEREKQFQQYNALKQLNENQEGKAKTVSAKAQLKDQNDAFRSLQVYLDSITESD